MRPVLPSRPTASACRHAATAAALLALVVAVVVAPPGQEAAAAHDGFTHLGTAQEQQVADLAAIAIEDDELLITTSGGASTLTRRSPVSEEFVAVAGSAALPHGLVAREVALADEERDGDHETAVIAAGPEGGQPTHVALAPLRATNPPAPTVYAAPAPSASFGHDIAAAGPLVFVGGLRNDGANTGVGYVSVIDLTVTDADGIPEPPAEDLTARDGEKRFGIALDTDGRTLVVAATPDTTETDPGHPVLYVYDLAAGLQVPQRLELPDLSTITHVAVHDDVIVAGEGFNVSASRTAVVRRDASSAAGWRQVQLLGRTLSVALADDRMLAETGTEARLYTVDAAGRFVGDRLLASTGTASADAHAVGLTDLTAVVAERRPPGAPATHLLRAIPLPPATRTRLTAGSGASAGTVTATVAGGTGTPTGTVSFTAGGQPIARCQAVPLTARAATCRPEITGPVTVAAVYAGTDDHGPSRTGPVSVDLAAAPTQTAILPTLTAEGDELTLLVEVTAPGGPVADGTVTISDEGLPIPGCIDLAVGADGRTPVCRPDMPGLRTFTAAFTPPSGLVASDAGPQDLLVPGLRAAPNPVREGNPVVLTGALPSAAPGDTIRFFADAASPAVCSGLVDTTTRVATCTHAFAVGDGTVELSIGTGTAAPPPNEPTPRRVLQVLPKDVPTVALTTPGDAVTGQPHPVTARVTGPADTPPPTGSVRWTTPGGAPVQGCPDTPLDATGRARCSVTTATAGAVTIVGTYLGDARYATGTADVTFEVLEGALVTLAASPSPSVVGQLVTYAVVVDGGPAGTPTGEVLLAGDGAGLDCAIALVDGRGSCALRHQEVGTIGMIASYEGDGVVGAGSARLDQVVQPAPIDQPASPPTDTPPPEALPPTEEEPVEVTRLAGEPRGGTGAAAQTSLLISGERFADASTFQQAGRQRAAAVVLSRDDVFADSLAGSALTADAPLLLTDPEALDPAVAEEVDRVLGGAGTVYLLGGESALGPAVADALGTAGYEVRRLAGTSRVETALAVADEVRRTHGGDTAAIARAHGTAPTSTDAWADAVAAGAWAARTGSPVLLTPSDALHPAVEAWLRAEGTARPTILGGEAAVADAVVHAVAEAVGGSAEDVVRVAGGNRFGTAVAVAERLWPTTPTGYLVTSGDHVDGWAYALAGSGLGADLDRPLLLVETERLPAEVDAALACGDAGARPATTVLGPASVVSDEVAAALGRC